MEEGREENVRKLLSLRSLVAALVMSIAMIVVPSASAASADLISGVQQQINSSGGTLPTTDPGAKTFVDNLVSSGVLPAAQTSDSIAAVKAIAAVAPNTPASVVAEVLGSGVPTDQIAPLVNITPTAAWDNFAKSYTLDSAPTGTSLKPLSDALRQLATASSVPYLATLADQIDAAGPNELSDALLGQLRGALALVSASLGDPLNGLNKLLGSLIPSQKTASSTPTTSTPLVLPPVVTPPPPAVVPFTLTLKVRKVTVNRTRKVAKIMLRSSAPTASLPVGFATMLGRKSAAKPVTFTLVTGKDVTKSVKLTRATTKALKKKGGSLKVTPAFAVPGLTSVPGVTVAATAKSLKVKKATTRRRARR